MNNIVKIIIIIIILGLIVSGITIAIYYALDNKKKTNNLKDNEIEMLNNQTNIKCPGPIQTTCQSGPPGPQGPSGGEFANHGPLRNTSNIKMVLERMESPIAADADVHFAEQNFRPQQTWTLHTNKLNSGGKISNQYGGCLIHNKNNLIKVQTCGNNPTKWMYTPEGKLKPTDEPDKCLTLSSNRGIFKNLAGTNENMKKELASKGVSLTDQLLNAELATCDKQFNPTQVWAFY